LPDIRVINTKNRIYKGFLSSIKERSLNNTTTKDIIREAEISQKTFYTYYENQNELLDEMEEECLTDLRDALIKDREALSQIDEVSNQLQLAELADQTFVNTIDTCANHREVAGTLLSYKGNINFLAKIKKLVSNEFVTRLPKLIVSHRSVWDQLRFTPNVKIPADYVTEIYVNLIVNIISYWLTSEDPISKRDVRNILGISQVLSPLQLLAGTDVPTNPINQVHSTKKTE
jgi:AcrR family transcriptional regulator